MPYFDWNATSPLHPAAREVLLEAVESGWANPSAPYESGIALRNRIELAREEMAAALNCELTELVFTSGAAESNNAVLRELSRRYPTEEVWVSAVEHPTVSESAEHWWPGRVRRIPVDGAGRVEVQWIEREIRRSRPALIAVMAANNETGVIQPWAEVSRICAEAEVPLHCDAAQWVGKASGLNFEGCAGLTLSAHKFGGPKGIGALVLRDSLRDVSAQCGGGQENGRRSGTENGPGILAMAAAFTALSRVEGATGRDAFERDLQAAMPGTVFNGAAVDRLWNTSSIQFPEFAARRWILRLDRLGFQVSGGAACSAASTGPSPVLAAMGRTAAEAERTVRVSGGWETSDEDWKSLVSAICEVREALKEDCAGRLARPIDLS